MQEQSRCLTKSAIGAGFFLAFAALLPEVAALSLKVPRIALGCFTDAVFYLAYARHFGELVLRYGFPYYATRFGGIFPDALSGALFGEINGIWVIRWILSSMVSLGLCLFFKRRYGLLTGIFASILWSFNPAALRLICTTYVDSTSVPFLIIGSCIFAAGWGGLYGALLSGVLFALASSAHLYAAFALLLLYPSFIGSFQQEGRNSISHTGWMLSGMVATLVIGWIWYWLAWGMPSIFSPTIEVMRDLGGGQASLWKKPLEEALHDTPAWIAPLVLLPAILYSSLNGGLVIRGITISLVASAGFFWGGDICGSAYVLSMPFYFSFLLPITIIAGAGLCGESLDLQKKVPRIVIFGILCAGAVLPSILTCYGLLTPMVSFFVPLLILALLPVWDLLANRFLVILSVAGITMSSLMIASTGLFSQFLGHYPAIDIPVLELSSALQKKLPMAQIDGKVTRFWYDDNPSNPGGTDRRMIGAYWLHTFGKLVGEHERFVPFPEISIGDVAAIGGSGVDRIVLFDQDSGKVTDALKSVHQTGLPFRILSRYIVRSQSDGSRVLDVAVLERNQPEPQGGNTKVDLQGIKPRNQGKIEWADHRALLSSGPEKWLYFARLPLGDLKKGDRIHVQCSITNGRVRFTLCGESDADVWHVEKWPILGEQEVLLNVPQDIPNATLELQNMFPNGSRSSLSIKDVFME